jgi:hypothetical protein
MTILQQTREALRLRHDASTTERTDLDWVEQFIRFPSGRTAGGTRRTWVRPRSSAVSRTSPPSGTWSLPTIILAFCAAGGRPKSVPGRDLNKSTLFNLTTSIWTLCFMRVRPRVTE